jgi:hypothetical protein
VCSGCRLASNGEGGGGEGAGASSAGGDRTAAASIRGIVCGLRESCHRLHPRL